MNETKYDIFEKLQEEITDFDSKGYYLTGEPRGNGYGDPGKKGTKGGYYYSQRETLESIDMASASKFKKGVLDAEGQRKTYMNIVNFYRDVMKMKIIIKVSNYIFEPRSMTFTWPVWFMGRQFGIYAEEESYDDELQASGHRLHKIVIDPDRFLVWSAANGGKVDAKARSVFASFEARRKDTGY